MPAEPGRLYAPGPFDRLELAGAARVLVVQGERDQAFVAGDAEVREIFRVPKIGAIAGWLAGQFMSGSGFGLLGDIVVGIIGAFAAQVRSETV